MGDNGASHFLNRLHHAFRGGASLTGTLDQYLNWTECDEKLPFMYARDLCRYVVEGVVSDVEAQYQARLAAQTKKKTNFKVNVTSLTQRPRLVGFTPGFDFPVGKAPRT